VSQLLPTGATASLGFNNSYLSSDPDGTMSGLESYWQSGLGLTLSQPLLKNFGREVTELSISVARLGKESSLEKLNATLIDVVAQVRTEYFTLYSLREELEVRKVSLELARRVLSDTQARVKAGVLPAMETLNAEFGVSGREKEMIDAERALHDQVDLLAQLLQLPPGSMVDTIDVPSKERYETSEQTEIQRALTTRPELKELKINRDLLALETRVAANRTRPDLLLSASASTAGLGNSYSRDMDRLSSGNYPAWGVGLALTYPLGNQVAENDYRKSRLKVDQATLQIRKQEELIANDIRSAIRAIEANYKQIEVADRGRVFAEERLRAWIRKSEVGLATTKDVLDVENDLAAAKNNQIKALVSYTNAITQLWKATGQILEKERVHLTVMDTDVLFRGVN
jgi:outer membrane protein TolC